MLQKLAALSIGLSMCKEQEISHFIYLQKHCMNTEAETKWEHNITSYK